MKKNNVISNILGAFNSLVKIIHRRKKFILFVLAHIIVIGLLKQLYDYYTRHHADRNEGFGDLFSNWYQNIGADTDDSGAVKKCRGYCDEKAEYDPPVLYPDFISAEEARYIMTSASPSFSESKVVSGSDTTVRKSQTAWLDKNDPIIAGVIERVCNLTNIPFENAEQLQVVKYEPNGYYNEHHDACCDDRQECIDFEKNGGQRKITMVLYLTDDFAGGATRFPKLNKEYKPAKFSGLMFYPLEKHGNKCHPYALHAGMPVTFGQKYIANVWLRERAYQI